MEKLRYGSKALPASLALPFTNEVRLFLSTIIGRPNTRGLREDSGSRRCIPKPELRYQLEPTEASPSLSFSSCGTGSLRMMTVHFFETLLKPWGCWSSWLPHCAQQLQAESTPYDHFFSLHLHYLPIWLLPFKVIMQVMLMQEVDSHGLGQLHAYGFAGYSLPPGCFHRLVLSVRGFSRKTEFPLKCFGKDCFGAIIRCHHSCNTFTSTTLEMNRNHEKRSRCQKFHDTTTS
nr:uncharacterized protein LOC105487030 [Macaca nemestrina]